MSTITLDAVGLTLPDQDGGINTDFNFIGSQRRMASGAMRVDYITEKAQIRLKWELLTKAERDIIRTQWQACLSEAKTLVLPTTESFSVFAALNGWTEEVRYGYEDIPYYILTTVFEEA